MLRDIEARNINTDRTCIRNNISIWNDLRNSHVDSEDKRKKRGEKPDAFGLVEMMVRENEGRIIISELYPNGNPWECDMVPCGIAVPLNGLTGYENKVRVIFTDGINYLVEPLDPKKDLLLGEGDKPIRTYPKRDETKTIIFDKTVTDAALSFTKNLPRYNARITR